MRVLVAPQEFKGTLTAVGVAQALSAGLRRALPEADFDLLPLADGGPGTLDALVDATRGRLLAARVLDPLGRAITARWGVLGDERTAVVEMAEASGLTLLRPEERDPRRASTFGTGQFLCAALDAGYQEIIVCVGGSATNDGGAGLGQSLGARLLDREGRDLPPGGAALAQLHRVNVSALDARPRESRIVVATDVTNPLCGPDGASLVYGAQKGASEAVARELDAALAHFAAIVKRDLAIDVADTPGAGAAGGLAYGLIVFCGATVRSGFDVVAEAVGLRDRVRAADLIVTGEGRIDRQTAFGKTPAGVAHAACAEAKPVVAVAGSVVREADESLRLFDAVFAIVPDVATEEEAFAHAAEAVGRVGERVGRWWRERR